MAVRLSPSPYRMKGDKTLPVYMICYQYTGDDGPQLASLFANTYAQAHDVMTKLVCGPGAQVQLYKFDYDKGYYIISF